VINIALLLPYDYRLMSVASILDVLETVNARYVNNRRDRPFRISLVQTSEQIGIHGNTFHDYAVKSIRSSNRADLVLIPSFHSSDLPQTMERNKMFVPWLQKQFKAGAEIASFCTAHIYSGLLVY
jgi:transcriptional regulator GlxA family with amidase domain